MYMSDKLSSIIDKQAIHAAYEQVDEAVEQAYEISLDMILESYEQDLNRPQARIRYIPDLTSERPALAESMNTHSAYMLETRHQGQGEEWNVNFVWPVNTMRGEDTMSKHCAFDYKTCRKLARLTQEQAADLLHISRRSLSAYENMRAPISDDLVIAMAELYQQRELVMWHLRYRTRYGAYLPDEGEEQNKELKNAMFQSIYEIATTAAVAVGGTYCHCLTGD